MDDPDDIDQRIAEAVWWAAHSDDYVRRMELLKAVWVEYLRRRERSAEDDG